MQVFETPGTSPSRSGFRADSVVVTAVDEPRTTRGGRPARPSRAPTRSTRSRSRAEARGDGHLITIEQKEQDSLGPAPDHVGRRRRSARHVPSGVESRPFRRLHRPPRRRGSPRRVDQDRVGRREAGRRRAEVRRQDREWDVRVGSIASGGQVVTVSGDLEVARVRRRAGGALGVGRRPHRRRSRPAPALDDLGRRRASTRSTPGKSACRPSPATSASASVTARSSSSTRCRCRAISSSDLGLESELAQEDDTARGPVVPLHVKTVSGDVQIVRSAGAFSV